MCTRLMGRVRGLAAAAIAATFWAVSAVASAVAADPVPTDRLLPPNVHVYVTVPDAREFAKRWDGSLLGQLWKDPEMGEFRKEVEKLVEEKSGELKEKLGLTVDDLMKLPSGEASFAVVQIPGKKPSFVAFLSYGDGEKTVDKLLDAAEEALDKNGAKKKESEVDDTKVILYTMPQKKNEDAEEGDEQPEPQQVGYFVRDKWLVVASDMPVIESIIARWDGKHEKTFAADPVYEYIVQRSKSEKSEAAVTWYANPIGLFQSVAQSSGNIQVALLTGLLPALGLSNFKAMGGSYDLDTAEYDSLSRTVLYVEQPTNGILNIFQFPAIEQAPPKWVPATASSWYGFNWDVGGAYDAVEGVVDQLRGPGTFSKLVDRMAQNEQGPKLHLRKDFIDLLSGRMDMYTEPPAKKDDDAATPDRFVLAMGLKDKAKMEGVLAKIAKTPGFPGKSREFEGTTIYEISSDRVGGGETSMGLTVANGQFLLSSDVTALEQLLRSNKDQEALADSADFKQVAKKLPTKASIAGFQKSDAQMKTAYDLLRSGQGAAITSEIDFGKLPAFDVVKKYLTPTGSYAEPDKNGVLFVSFSLKAK